MQLHIKSNKTIQKTLTGIITIVIFISIAQGLYHYANYRVTTNGIAFNRIYHKNKYNNIIKKAYYNKNNDTEVVYLRNGIISSINNHTKNSNKYKHELEQLTNKEPFNFSRKLSSAQSQIQVEIQ